MKTTLLLILFSDLHYLIIITNEENKIRFSTVWLFADGGVYWRFVVYTWKCRFVVSMINVFEWFADTW